MTKKNHKPHKINLKEKSTRNKTRGDHKWIFTVTLVSFFVSGSLLYVSTKMINNINIIISVVFVFVIIFIGIFADMIGIAVTAADETQFHSMVAKRIRGSKISIILIRHAHKVSSLLNDVVGDICGVISGAITALLVVYIVSIIKSLDATFLGIIFSGSVAGLTIGGKAVGKTIAMKKSNTIVYRTAFFVTFAYSEKWGKKSRKDYDQNT